MKGPYIIHTKRGQSQMTDEEVAARILQHKKRVERRAKFFATLTPHERKVRDSHVAWVRWWRKEYKVLVEQISKNKAFIRHQGHNNLASLKLAMRRLENQRRQARGMVLARMASKVDYAMKIDRKS